MPDSDVQKTIGDMSTPSSAKIELNRRMNETLEAMARAIFKSWFVDFDPVRAKASELIAERHSAIRRRLSREERRTWNSGVPFIRAGELNNGFDTVNAGD
ncbi:MAG: hypothetical protein IPH39_18165 [Sulfuritalea sp.]|nr:hypothetical protein [Sulfuritalea sp.]